MVASAVLTSLNGGSDLLIYHADQALNPAPTDGVGPRGPRPNPLQLEHNGHCRGCWETCTNNNCKAFQTCVQA